VATWKIFPPPHGAVFIVGMPGDVRESDDGKRQAPSVYTVLMKRLLTEGLTDEMLNHCTTRSSLMAFIKRGNYMLNPAFGSRCVNSGAMVENRCPT
jgi:hypothetical protein